MKHYLTGFAVAMTIMVVLNLIPYVLSRGSYARSGGWAAFLSSASSKVQSLIADIAVALATSIVAGGLWMEHARQRK